MRIAILGNAGSGKSTLALKLATDLSLPLHEIDKFLWQDGWVAASETDYETAHAKAINVDAWIIDGLGRSASLPARLTRATHIIFCDFPVWQNYWLLAERQLKWTSGTLALRPGDQTEMPATKRLFEAVAQIDTEMMPTLREQVEAQRNTKPVYHLTSFEALQGFTFPAAK